MLAPDVDSIPRRLREIDVPRKARYALSVQAGAGLVAPHSAYREVHLYVGDGKDIEFFKNALFGFEIIGLRPKNAPVF